MSHDPTADSSEPRYWRDLRLGDLRFIAMPRPYSVAPQAYSTHTVGTVDEGRVLLETADQELVVGPGDVVFVPAGVLHALRTVTPADTDVARPQRFASRALYLSAADAERLIGVATAQRLAARLLLFSAPELACRIGAIQERHLALLARGADTRVLWNDIARMLADIADRASGSPLSVPLADSCSRSRPAPSAAIRHAHALLEASYAEPIAVEWLAGQCGVSSEHLIRAFRDAYWLTPHQWLVSRRTRRGRELLEAGASVADAAAHSGFFDQSHFHRWFIRSYAVAPGRYRAAARTG